MISNYYTLHAMASFVRLTYADWTLGEPFTQRRNELVLPLSTDDGNRQASVIVSCEPSANFLVCKDSVSRARRNSTAIFPQIAGNHIDSCIIHPSDRIISISLDSGCALLCRFFGSRANVFYSNAHGSVEGSFLRTLNDAGDIQFPFSASALPAPDDVIGQNLHADVPISLGRMLRQAYPMLGPLLVRELCFRASIDPEEDIHSLSDGSARSLERSIAVFLDELTERPVPRIILRNGEPLHFSITPLRHLSDCSEDLQPTISLGILRYLSSQRRIGSFLSNKKKIFRVLQKNIKTSDAARTAASASLTDATEIELLERYGTILKTNLSSITKGMTSFTAQDPFESEPTSRTIQLDPSLSPVRNAERYFQRARNARKRAGETGKRLEKIEHEQNKLHMLVAELEEISDNVELDIFLRDHAKDVHGLSVQSPERRDTRQVPPFRVFTVAGGFEVWVGKNSANNDLLTTRHTGKNDLWFHARGVGGSHVVLKAGTGRGDIPKQAKVAAAAIAAYFSKMKNARHVPVSMCLGKFVHKPRHAPVGTVKIEREDVVFADPALPPQT